MFSLRKGILNRLLCQNSNFGVSKFQYKPFRNYLAGMTEVGQTKNRIIVKAVRGNRYLEVPFPLQNKRKTVYYNELFTLNDITNLFKESNESVSIDVDFSNAKQGISLKTSVDDFFNNSSNGEIRINVNNNYEIIMDSKIVNIVKDGLNKQFPDLFLEKNKEQSNNDIASSIN